LLAVGGDGVPLLYPFGAFPTPLLTVGRLLPKPNTCMTMMDRRLQTSEIGSQPLWIEVRECYLSRRFIVQKVRIQSQGQLNISCRERSLRSVSRCTRVIWSVCFRRGGQCSKPSGVRWQCKSEGCLNEILSAKNSKRSVVKGSSTTSTCRNVILVEFSEAGKLSKVHAQWAQR
jgi:hypothetical protein